MTDLIEETPDGFSTRLPVIVFIRPAAEPRGDWQEFDRGPGIFHFPPDSEINVRIQTIDDAAIKELVEDLRPCRSLRFLNLSENRRVTDAGLTRLTALVQLTGLNLSSCDLTSDGLAVLAALPRLEHLDISFCNRLTDDITPHLRRLARLKYLDLQGTPKVKLAVTRMIERRGLVIHK